MGLASMYALWHSLVIKQLAASLPDFRKRACPNPFLRVNRIGYSSRGYAQTVVMTPLPSNAFQGRTILHCTHFVVGSFFQCRVLIKQSSVYTRKLWC